jgi:hypothetical protein
MADTAPARYFASFTLARAQLRKVLDAAEDGAVTRIDRDDTHFVVLNADLLRRSLMVARPANAVVVAEAGGFSAFLPGTPIAGVGETLAETLDDLVDALRDYAEDWNDHLRTAPNHRGNLLLVTLVDTSSDDELRTWLLGTPLDTATTAA